MNIQERIIDMLRRNRISTTEVADCLNKSGLIPGVAPIVPYYHKVGPVFWAYAYNQSNWAIHEQLRDFPEGAVLLALPVDCDNRAMFGALVTKYLMLYRQAEAVVVQGPLRDMPHLLKERWPIWCIGATPIGCFNRQEDAYLDPEREAALRAPFDGAIAVCDDSGVIYIPKARQDEAFLKKLQWIEDQEDTWFDCIDRLKWDTYDTVCLKKYREQV